jgi:hypothetical protein
MEKLIGSTPAGMGLATTAVLFNTGFYKGRALPRLGATKLTTGF